MGGVLKSIRYVKDKHSISSARRSRPGGVRAGRHSAAMVCSFIASRLVSRALLSYPTPCTYLFEIIATRLPTVFRHLQPRVELSSINLGRMAPPTPILDQFIGSVSELIQERDGSKLQDFLQIEPPLSDIYQRMIEELRQRYPPGPQSDTELQQRCEILVPRTKGSSSWSAFPTFMRLYFSFLRDVNVENLLDTYNLLRALLK